MTSQRCHGLCAEETNLSAITRFALQRNGALRSRAETIWLLPSFSTWLSTRVNSDNSVCTGQWKENQTLVLKAVLKRRCQLLGFIVSFNISNLWLQHACWRFTACTFANLCLYMLLSSEQCQQFERFRLQCVQVVNKTSSFKTKLTGNNPETNRVNRNTRWCLTFPQSIQTFSYIQLTDQFWTEGQTPPV